MAACQLGVAQRQSEQRSKIEMVEPKWILI
jgi:hypothetical protein